MVTDFIILSLALAGGAVLWRNAQQKSPRIRAVLASWPKILSTPFTCGSCFSFWIALAAVTLGNPLRDWAVPVREFVPAGLDPFLHFFVSWFALGMMTVFIRFAYVAIQESVSYITHTLLKHHSH